MMTAHLLRDGARHHRTYGEALRRDQQENRETENGARVSHALDSILSRAFLVVRISPP
jgi:hypothetical protein